MRLINRDARDRARFVVIMLEDETGVVLDTRMHAGTWTAEDQKVRNHLLDHIERIAPSMATKPNQVETSQIDTGERTYLVTVGGRVRIGAVVEGRGSKELQRRFAYAIHSMMSVEWARAKTGHDMTGPITRENLLDFVVRGDAALPPKLVGPQHFGPL